MDCPQCRHANPPGSNYCSGCGTRLRPICPACANDLPPGARFCNTCGAPVEQASVPDTRFASPESYTPRHLAEKILTSRSALEGERKQVTVLFVDVSGFTALSERLDPEVVHGLMARAFELMLAEIHRYEGTVNQFLGDGTHGAVRGADRARGPRPPRGPGRAGRPAGAGRVSGGAGARARHPFPSPSGAPHWPGGGRQHRK